MPTLQLQIAPLQNPDRYRALAHALTQLTAQYLGKRPEVTAVVIDDLPAALVCRRHRSRRPDRFAGDQHHRGHEYRSREGRVHCRGV